MLFLLADTQSHVDTLIQHGPYGIAFITSALAFVRYLFSQDKKIRLTRERVTNQYLEKLQQCQAEFMCEISNLHVEHQATIKQVCSSFTGCNTAAILAINKNTEVTTNLAREIDRLVLTLNSVGSPPSADLTSDDLAGS